MPQPTFDWNQRTDHQESIVVHGCMDGLVITADAPLENDELNSLFARSWPSHVRRDFGRVLARSLVHISARFDGQLIGFANVATDGGEHAFLVDPTVAPEFRRQGIGRALVHRAVAESRRRGARWLHVDYALELEPFYRSAGFQPTAAGLIRLDADATPK
jgi:GNAT superfamily N-acetyltransferase